MLQARTFAKKEGLGFGPCTPGVAMGRDLHEWCVPSYSRASKEAITSARSVFDKEAYSRTDSHRHWPLPVVHLGSHIIGTRPALLRSFFPLKDKFPRSELGSPRCALESIVRVVGAGDRSITLNYLRLNLMTHSLGVLARAAMWLLEVGSLNLSYTSVDYPSLLWIFCIQARPCVVSPLWLGYAANQFTAQLVVMSAGFPASLAVRNVIQDRYPDTVNSNLHGSLFCTKTETLTRFHVGINDISKQKSLSYGNFENHLRDQRKKLIDGEKGFKEEVEPSLEREKMGAARSLRLVEWREVFYYECLCSILQEEGECVEPPMGCPQEGMVLRAAEDKDPPLKLWGKVGTPIPVRPAEATTLPLAQALAHTGLSVIGAFKRLYRVLEFRHRVYLQTYYRMHLRVLQAPWMVSTRSNDHLLDIIFYILITMGQCPRRNLWIACGKLTIQGAPFGHSEIASFLLASQAHSYREIDRANRAPPANVVKLQEIGPEMTLQLVKGDLDEEGIEFDEDVEEQKEDPCTLAIATSYEVKVVSSRVTSQLGQCTFGPYESGTGSKSKATSPVYMSKGAFQRETGLELVDHRRLLIVFSSLFLSQDSYSLDRHFLMPRLLGLKSSQGADSYYFACSELQLFPKDGISLLFLAPKNEPLKETVLDNWSQSTPYFRGVLTSTYVLPD
ncbi:hypothetical protein VNO77_19399 [Canavalia gladiata]|uniref:Uncharacterized protein n=1 Tax=Canavalia gladiata TaxID=3824 RepID=A0AAN9LSH9_CANGL